MATTATDAYTFRLTTNATGVGARLGSMRGEGPLNIGAAHILRQLLPADITLVASANATYRVNMHLIDYLIGPSLILSEELLDASTCFCMLETRCAAFFRDLLAAGMQMNQAGSLKQLRPCIYAFATNALTIAQRTLWG